MYESGETGRNLADLSQLVVFVLAGETYGVDIFQVREIIRVPEVTRVPRTPDFVEGVINLRGGVIPIIDLRRRFGLGTLETSDETRIVIVELDEQLVGMRVDGVSEVLRVDPEQIEPPSPYVVNVNSQFVTGIARYDDRLVILVDLNRILKQEEIQQLQQTAEAMA